MPSIQRFDNRDKLLIVCWLALISLCLVMADPEEKKLDRPLAVPHTLKEFKTKSALQSHLFGPMPPSTLWEVPVSVSVITPQRLRHFAGLANLADAYRIFTDDSSAIKRPQQDVFTLFWYIWSRCERSHPFLYFTISYAEFANYDQGFRRRLNWIMLYTRWYWAEHKRRLPVMIPLITFPGKGHFAPEYENTKDGHMTMLLCFPHGRGLCMVHIDTSGFSRVYTEKWTDELLLPLFDMVSDTYDRQPVVFFNLTDPIQKFGSCSTFSFMMALDIIRSPESEWFTTVRRLVAWQKEVGVRASRRRMGTFLGNAGLVFKVLARFMLEAETVAFENGFRPRGPVTAEPYLAKPFIRRLWRDQFSAKLKKYLERASFIRSEALLLPDAKQLAKMKRSAAQARRIIRRDPARPPRVPKRRPKPEQISSAILPSASPPRLYRRLRPNRDGHHVRPRNLFPVAIAKPPPLPPFNPPMLPPALPPYNPPSPPRVFRRLRKAG